MKYLIAIVCVVFMWSAPSYAQHAHGGEKGPNGGPMEDVAGIDAELMTSGNKITINVFDPKTTKPVATKNFAAAVMIASGSTRETVTLAPQGENSLQGDAKSPVAAGATITLTIKTAEGQSGQAKFKK